MSSSWRTRNVFEQYSRKNILGCENSLEKQLFQFVMRELVEFNFSTEDWSIIFLLETGESAIP